VQGVPAGGGVCSALNGLFRGCVCVNWQGGGRGDCQQLYRQCAAAAQSATQSSRPFQDGKITRRPVVSTD